MEIIGAKICKPGKTSLLIVEAEKTLRARAIGQSSGLFYVPEVLGVDPAASRIEFEYIESLETLRTIARRGDTGIFDLLEQVGRSLRVVHQELVLDDDMRIPLPEAWIDRDQEANVFIHGDFMLGNTAYDSASNRLVLLDWSAAPFFGRTPTYGSRYFDVLWFLSRLFNDATCRQMFKWDAEGMADAFLQGYGGDKMAELIAGIKVHWPNVLPMQKAYIHQRLRNSNLLPGTLYYVMQFLMTPRLRRYSRSFTHLKTEHPSGSPPQ